MKMRTARILSGIAAGMLILSAVPASAEEQPAEASQVQEGAAAQTQDAAAQPADTQDAAAQSTDLQVTELQLSELQPADTQITSPTSLPALKPKKTEYTTEDGVLSITTPGVAWKAVEDAGCWFVLSDGNDLITIDHLNPGDSLPETVTKDANYEAVCHMIITARSDTFAVDGCAVDTEALEDVLSSIGTIRILEFNKKLQTEDETAEEPVYGEREINQDYYVISDKLSARESYTYKSRYAGLYSKSDKIRVLARVTKDGEDYGWYRVNYKNMDAYVPTAFVSETKPSLNDNSINGLEQMSLYGQQGSIIRVYRAMGETEDEWTDSRGLVYVHLPGTDPLYHETINDNYWSSKESYWEEQALIKAKAKQEQEEKERKEAEEKAKKEAEEKARQEAQVQTQSVLLYGIDGSMVRIYRKTGQTDWWDSKGLLYYQEGNDPPIFFEPNYGTYWCTDQTFWGQPQPQSQTQTQTQPQIQAQDQARRDTYAPDVYDDAQIVFEENPEEITDVEYYDGYDEATDYVDTAEEPYEEVYEEPADTSGSGEYTGDELSAN